MTKLSIRFSHTPKIIFASSSKHSGTVVGQRPLHALSSASSRKIYRITQTLLKFSFSSAADDPSYLEISDRLHSLLSLFLFLSGINVSIFFCRSLRHDFEFFKAFRSFFMRSSCYFYVLINRSFFSKLNFRYYVSILPLMTLYNSDAIGFGGK